MNFEKLLLVPTDKILTTPRFQLEPIIESHAPKLFENLQAPELYIFIPHQPPQSVEALQKRYARLAVRHSDQKDEIWLNWAIKLKDRENYVGTLQATLKETGETYIAYEIFPAYWRQKMAREACSRMLKLLFEEYDLEKISSLMDTRNEASWRLMESLGFQKIKEIKDADYFKGSASDEFLYELEKTNFQSIE